MKKKRTAQGMTLVEIIFAFAIVSTVLTLAYAAALGAWRNATSANQRTQAQYMIQQTVEAIKAYRESGDFSWDTFIGQVNTAGAQMKIGLQQADGTITYNDFTCSQVGAPADTPNECQFVVESGGVGLTAVGSNVVVASNYSVNVTVVPTAYFTEGIVDASPVSGALPDNTTAITFVVNASWTDANGIASNASASTIITEPR